MDLATYKTQTGAQRFRRTKEEIARGLTPEQALAERLGTAPDAPEPAVQVKKNPGNGVITLVLRPSKGTDADYFEFFPKTPIVLELDPHFYKWLDTFIGGQYDGNIENALKGMLYKMIEDRIVYGH